MRNKIKSNKTKKKKNFLNFIRNNSLLIFTLIYLFLPIDLLPEFFVGILGPFVIADDLLLVTFTLIYKFIQFRRKN